MTTFALLSLAAWASVVLVAAVVRGRPYVFFVAVMLGLYTLIACTLAPSPASRLLPGYAFAHAAVYVSFVFLARPRMRPLVFRLLVSWPAAWFLGGTLLAFPWAIGRGFGLDLPLVWLPYAVAALGFVDTFVPRRSRVHVVLGEPGPEVLGRRASSAVRNERPLRLVQITDPHLGPFMSVARLKRICERAVASNPDLVLLTGDFLTMESQSDQALLGAALAPLASLPGKCFACFGNHDHEAPEHVRSGLASAGIALLMDAQVEVDTGAGKVEILGFDFTWRDRQAHLANVSARHPRGDAPIRIALLHDPGAFKHLPSGTADLVLSGHTHGGQLGLLWFGLPQTFLSAFTKIPDHGLWGRGKERLYIHRGTGHYGFPLRLGVPPEESLLEVHRASGP